MIPSLSINDFYDALGQLAECPREENAGLLEHCRKGLIELCPEGSTSLVLFQKALSGLSWDQKEEAYLRAFDITPLAVPYVSIHLFGEESYKRGEFMAKFLESHQLHGFDCGTELPDHVAVMLRFAGKLQAEERREMLELCLKEPVRKMTFSLKKSDHPYQFLLQAFLDVIETDLKTEVCHA
jgi:nitrate reductase assembly molybdenum cofactor insertion protein NarJ